MLDLGEAIGGIVGGGGDEGPAEGRHTRHCGAVADGVVGVGEGLAGGVIGGGEAVEGVIGSGSKSIHHNNCLFARK